MGNERKVVEKTEPLAEKEREEQLDRREFFHKFGSGLVLVTGTYAVVSLMDSRQALLSEGGVELMECHKTDISGCQQCIMCEASCVSEKINPPGGGLCDQGCIACVHSNICKLGKQN